jgi:hypothetical protein
MKYTLLEIVQEILNDISGDEVDSISDTSEATQIANIVKSTYYHLISQKDLPEHKGVFNLVESADTSAPIQMSLPSHALRLSWIKYDKYELGETNSRWEEVYYRPWGEFLLMQNMLNEDDTNTSSMTITTADSDTWELKYQTDRHPQYWSTPDDNTVYFSSYKSTVDTDLYLYSEKTQCYGLVKPTFTFSDGFTPDLDATEFNWLVEESKMASSIKLRQVDDPVASRRSRRGWIRSQRSKNVPSNLRSYQTVIPNYGRRR